MVLFFFYFPMKVARGNLRLQLSLNGRPDCAIHGTEVGTVDNAVRDNIKEQRFLFLKWQYSQVAYTFILFFRSIPIVGKFIAIHWINHYPVDKHLENQFVLSTGWRITQWIYSTIHLLNNCVPVTIAF